MDLRGNTGKVRTIALPRGSRARGSVAANGPAMMPAFLPRHLPSLLRPCSLLLLPAALLACGGGIASSSADGGPGSDAGPGADAIACDPPQPSWALGASQFDQRCAVDTDCEPVYLGPDACDDPGAGNCACPNAAIARSSASAYESALDAINTSASCQACRTSPGGCDCAAPLVYCNAGTCAVCLSPGPNGTCAPTSLDGGAACQVNSDCHKTSPDECTICTDTTLVCHAGECVCACQVD